MAVHGSIIILIAKYAKCKQNLVQRATWFHTRQILLHSAFAGHYIDFWTQTLDDGGNIDAIYTDFKKSAW